MVIDIIGGVYCLNRGLLEKKYKKNCTYSPLSLFLVLSFYFISNNVFAFLSNFNETWVISLSAGPVWADGGATQTLYLTPTIEKTFVASHNHSNLAHAELFVGLLKKLSPNITLQSGLALGAITKAKLLGVIWDDGDPRFDNYNYQYKIQHTQLLIQNKFLINTHTWALPWISGALGVGFNKTYSYNNLPKFFAAVQNPNFIQHTEKTVTYTAGAGVQKMINLHWQMGMGYFFTNWGKVLSTLLQDKL